MTDTPRHPLDDWLDTVRLLWPGAEVTAAPRGRAGRAARRSATRTFTVLLSSRNPKVLVPTDSRMLAIGAANRTTSADRLSRHYARGGLAGLLRTGLGPVLFRDTIIAGRPAGESVEDYLAEVAGEPVRVAISIGSARANRKPVLHVYTVRGREVGFAKVGSTPLANRLVRAEAGTLTTLAGRRLANLDCPRVIHHGRWQGCEVLLLQAMPAGRSGTAGLPVAAMRELAAVAPVGADAPAEPVALAESPWLAGVATRSATVDHGFAATLDDVARALVHRHPAARLQHGSWHGDWGPWNMSWHRGRPQVWDWERFAGGVPVGFDAAHYVAHPVLQHVGRREAALTALATSVPAAVADLLGCRPDRPETAAVVDAYLLEMACRFGADSQPEPADPIRRAAAWHLELAAARLGVGGGHGAPAAPDLPVGGTR